MNKGRRITRRSIPGLANGLTGAPSATPAIVLYGPLLEEA